MTSLADVESTVIAGFKELKEEHKALRRLLTGHDDDDDKIHDIGDFVPTTNDGGANPLEMLNIVKRIAKLEAVTKENAGLREQLEIARRDAAYYRAVFERQPNAVKIN